MGALPAAQGGGRGVTPCEEEASLMHAVGEWGLLVACIAFTHDPAT